MALGHYLSPDVNRAYFSGSGALETVRIACDLVGTLAGLAKRLHGTKCIA